MVTILWPHFWTIWVSESIYVCNISLAAQSQDLRVLCHVWLLLGQSGGRNLGVRLNNYTNYALDIVVLEGVAERKS